jgi:hypothetical protein|tara:strand:- start:561 stop:749 length:189 start_codon:yes stop_codon:yes gene_type:complete
MIDKILDRLQELSIMAIVYLGVALWIAIFGIIVLSAFENDPVIGTSEHGIIIRESDLEKEDE